MISPAFAASGVKANKAAARISDLNILFLLHDRAVIGLLTQYYGAVKPRFIALTLKS
ncbi:hypothetical protein CKO_00406 [Citrobacter koseri ATCC BAA-895]|uniref:Uncharacterized protein n=1 Tax=Citrobacter koseri (strain ATCC BAA-895 / CDC 4225-83 / SGSC4696) TaxID=290338 RepID=A8ADK0_CITK8|nr:hypothetical protein CKO_00406 [Citrobacter koseri ATCC BAA-895]